MSTNKIITVSTKGEKSTFTISSSDEHNSLNFFCDACRSEKPIASILHSNEHFWFFKRNGSGFELKKRSLLRVSGVIIAVLITFDRVWKITMPSS